MELHREGGRWGVGGVCDMFQRSEIRYFEGGFSEPPCFRDQRSDILKGVSLNHHVSEIRDQTFSGDFL